MERNNIWMKLKACDTSIYHVVKNTSKINKICYDNSWILFKTHVTDEFMLNILNNFCGMCIDWEPNIFISLSGMNIIPHRYSPLNEKLILDSCILKIWQIYVWRSWITTIKFVLWIIIHAFFAFFGIYLCLF